MFSLRATDAIPGLNCTESTLCEFPHLLTDIRGRHELTVFSSLASAYFFVALAIVCDEYFVPAVERLCYRLNLSYDVGGATLLAATTSSPEFFVNCVGTFISEGDLGVGTIVGSSVFNSLAIVGLAAICAGMTIQLDWWPITRDLSWYFFSIFLVTIILFDGAVYWYEALVLLIVFCFNITALLTDRKMQKKLRHEERTCFLSCFVPVSDDIPDKNDTMVVNPADEDTEEPFDFFGYAYLETNYERSVWLITWPIHALYFITIPNCRREFFKNWLWSSVLMCMLWISLLSYLISWMLTVVGYMIYLPDSVMGITFLAAGTSIPEAVSSVIVTRKGYGSMAICNSISSNTFDILFCLGVPWFVKTAFGLGAMQRDYVALNSSGLAYVTATLLVTGSAMYIVFLVWKFELSKVVGWTCIGLYLLYLVIACLIELNVFGTMNMPTCEMKDHSDE